MQTIECCRISAVYERDTIIVNLHLVEREEADIAVRDTLLHLLHEEARRCQILGIVVEAAEYEGAMRERLSFQIGDGRGKLIVDAREEIPQLRPCARVRVTSAMVRCRNAIGIEGFYNKTGRIRIDLDHADMPFLVEDKVKAREPRRQSEHIWYAQIGKQFAWQIHRTRKVVGGVLQHLRCLAEDAKQPRRGTAHLVIEILWELLHRMCGVAVSIVTVLDIGEDCRVKCVDVGLFLCAAHVTNLPRSGCPPARSRICG